MLVAFVPDDLVKAPGVGAQPLARRGTRCVVDDRQAVWGLRAPLERRHHLREVVGAVVAEQDDVDRLGHAQSVFTARRRIA